MTEERQQQQQQQQQQQLLRRRRRRRRTNHHAFYGALTRRAPGGCILLWWSALWLLVLYPTVTVVHASSFSSSEESEESVFEAMENEIYAVLFPWFIQFLGVAAYYVLSRHAHILPATAIMFVIGALIGFAVPRVVPANDITRSAEAWIGMEGKVLLLVFLPGLLFLDSYKMDFHLFVMTFWQIVILAFPMVLVGTVLTALVAKYMFVDFGWSFDLCMTFGAILSATDPVAIAVLLNELGAPARLQVSSSKFFLSFFSLHNPIPIISITHTHTHYYF
jgi:hypothetical protein